jgi:hypothetical protein
VLRLRVLPLLLGAGRSFAPSDLGLHHLSLATAQSFVGGVVVLEYNVAPLASGPRFTMQIGSRTP